MFSIHKDQFDSENLDILVSTSYFNKNSSRSQTKISNDIILNKSKTINDVNVYENSCNILYDSSVIIKLLDPSFNDLLKGNGEFYIFEDDIDYNHVNDHLGNVCYPQDYELSYSVNNSFYKKSAITLFIDPLKYPQLVSLVLFEFLQDNNYPQDIKNIILMLYNDV